MIDAGVLGADEKYGLIDGVIVPMSRESSRHLMVKARLATALGRSLGDECVVVPDGPLYLSGKTFVEPDVCVVPYGPDIAHTTGPNVHLVCEVAATGLPVELGSKARLYASHQVPELWVIDARTLETEVHRLPGPDGYRSAGRVGPGGTLVPQCLPSVAITLADLRL